MGYYASGDFYGAGWPMGDPGFFDWLGGAAKTVMGVAGTVAPIAGAVLAPFTGGASLAIGGAIGGLANIGGHLLSGSGTTPSLASSIAPVLNQMAPPSPGGSAWESLWSMTQPPNPSFQGYSTAAWQDYDPWSDEYEIPSQDTEPNLGYQQPPFAMTSPGLQYAPSAPETAAADFRRALKF